MSKIIPINYGLMSSALFPVLAGTLILVILSTWVIHYPDLIKARAVVTRVDSSGKGFWVEGDIPQGEANRIKPGLNVQLKFDADASGKYDITDADLDEVVNYNDKNNIISAHVSLAGDPARTTLDTTSFRTGVKANLLITVKDMRLLQRLFYR